MEKKKEFNLIDYRTAIRVCTRGNGIILCNDVTRVVSIDYESYGEPQNLEIAWDEEHWKRGLSEEEREDFIMPDIYQYYLTSMDKYMVDRAVEDFPELIFMYSDALDLWVLCVPHWGTSWDGINTETTLTEEEIGNLKQVFN